jgi:hypothetical protein
MTDMLEKFKTFTPVIETGLKVFLPSPELKVTETMKKQRNEFLKQFPRTAKLNVVKSRKQKDEESEVMYYRTMIAMYQNEIIAQSAFIDQLENQLAQIQAALLSK